MTIAHGTGNIDWRLAEQHFTGTPDQIAAELDDLILKLVAYRQSLEHGLPVATPRRISGWHRFRAAIGLAVAIALGAAGSTAAQDAAAATGAPRPAWADLLFGATLEGFYEWNANEPPDRVNALRAYDARANTFGIQQVATVIELPPAVDAGRRLGFRFDLQFGPASDATQGNPVNEPRPEVYRHLWQAYGTYVAPLGRGLQLDFGKFASNLGYETNYARDNQAYSRAYLFNFLPYYHMGLRATLPVHDRVTLMGTLTNGVQQTEEFNDFKSVQVSATVKPIDRLSWTLNGYVGREQPDAGLPDGPDGTFRVFDTYATYTASERLSLGLDVNHTSNAPTAAAPSLSLVGLGAYLRFAATLATAIGVRYEHIDDEGLFGGIAQVLDEVTLTAERRLADGLLFRAEYRHDWSNRRVFASDDGLERRQPTVLVGAIWWFGNKSGAR